MAGQKYNFKAYKQAVYRDGRNPTFWCSIGVLYFQINQSPCAHIRGPLESIHTLPKCGLISAVCMRVATIRSPSMPTRELANLILATTSQRLQLLKKAQATGGQLPAAPGPQVYIQLLVRALSFPLLVSPVPLSSCSQHPPQGLRRSAPFVQIGLPWAV